MSVPKKAKSSDTPAEVHTYTKNCVSFKYVQLCQLHFNAVI